MQICLGAEEVTSGSTSRTEGLRVVRLMRCCLREEKKRLGDCTMGQQADGGGQRQGERIKGALSKRTKLHGHHYRGKGEHDPLITPI